MATKRSVRNTENTSSAVIESPVASAPKPTEIRLCLCGECGKAVIGKKARFVTGHDAKLKARLLAEARNDSDLGRKQMAVQDLEELGWSHFNKPTAAMVRKAERAAKAAAVESVVVAVEREAAPSAATA